LLNEVCGGPLPGRTFKAVIPGGSSAKILRFGERFKGKRKVGADMVDYDWGVEDVPMDFDSLGMIGTMGGSGGVIVMDDSVNMVEALANINAFYSHESCGQCTPCREGSLWMKKITTRMVHGQARTEDAALLKSVADQIPGRTICAFGEACSWPTQSFVAKFGDEFKGTRGQELPEARRTPATWSDWVPRNTRKTRNTDKPQTRAEPQEPPFGVFRVFRG
jgi:NADH-quinone oxidoreductase subunit F